MTVDQPGSRWQLHRVLQYIRKVEAAYNVSIKLWLDLVDDGRGGAVARIHATGSGEAFDLIPLGVQARKSEVNEEEPYAIGEAVYYGVLFIEMQLNKVREPLGARPSL